MKKLDPKDIHAALERASQRGPVLPGDPIEAIARARAAAPKRLSFTQRLAGVFAKKKKNDPLSDIRGRLAASVEGRQAAFDRVAEQMPVDPPEIAYLAHRRAAAGR